MHFFFSITQQYFVFDFHVPPDVMFDKILKISVSRLILFSLSFHIFQQVIVCIINKIKTHWKTVVFLFLNLR